MGTVYVATCIRRYQQNYINIHINAYIKKAVLVLLNCVLVEESQFSALWNSDNDRNTHRNVARFQVVYYFDCFDSYSRGHSEAILWKNMGFHQKRQ